jgi:hypothetical protein
MREAFDLMAFITRIMITASLITFPNGCGAPSSADEGDAKPVAEAEGALSAGGLTRAQSATALDLIDDICGDTWCEGDHDFEFRALACSGLTSRCALVFKITPRDDVPGARPFYLRTCTTGGFRGFESLVTTSESGYQSLDWTYYEALSECISRLEDELG